MMVKRNRIVRCVSVLAALLWSDAAAAETIYLKDGRRVEARITQHTQESVTVDWFGVPLTYWRDEIERIDNTRQDSETTRILEAPDGASGSPGTAGGSPDDTARVELIKPVMKFSGMEQQLTQMRELVVAQVDPQQDARVAGLGPKQHERFRHIVSEAFAYEALSDSVFETFSERFDEQKFRGILDWLRSPLATRLIELGSPEEKALAFERFVAQLERHPPSPERVLLVRRLDQATGASESVLGMAVAMVTAMGQAFEMTGRTEAELQQAVQRAREVYHTRYRDQIESGTQNKFLFTYRTLSDEELKPYVEFWESELGRWFSQLSAEAITRTFSDASERMSVPLMRLMGEPQADGGDRP